MEENHQTVFRKKTLERISSPDQLTDYLCVTNPGIWVVLVAVILLLAGVFAWSMVGTLETKTEVKIIVSEHTAQIIPLSSETLAEGMSLRVSGQEVRIASSQTDEYGRSVGVSEVNLPDGIYDGIVVTEAVHPISFLMESR
ncbi:MAG: hypothetical protein II885_17500 [Oscillospiraceae bacterium]|nr:hypothetical protein [Oscillospiraceae bacterium]